MSPILTYTIFDPDGSFPSSPFIATVRLFDDTEGTIFPLIRKPRGAYLVEVSIPPEFASTYALIDSPEKRLDDVEEAYCKEIQKKIDSCTSIFEAKKTWYKIRHPT